MEEDIAVLGDLDLTSTANKPKNQFSHLFQI